MQRVESIDVIRGSLLSLMMFDHIFFMPMKHWSFVSKVSYGFLGYITAAECFFFMSGFVCFFALYKKLLANKTCELKIQLHKRSRQIYFWHLVLFFVASTMVSMNSIFSDVFRINPYIGSFIEHPWLSFLFGSIFLSLHPLLDILPLYVGFIFIAPYLMKQIHQGRLLPILFGSVSLWIGAQYFSWAAFITDLAQKSHLPLSGGYFNPFAWQLLFVLGLVAGWGARTGRLKFFVQSKMILIFAALIYAFLLAVRHKIITFMNVPSSIIDIPSLGVLRLVHFSSFIVLIANIATHFPSLLSSKSLAMLGRHSLHVFSFHVIVLYIATPLNLILRDRSAVLQIAFCILLMSSLWLPAIFRERKKNTQFAGLNIKRQAFASE